MRTKITHKKLLALLLTLVMLLSMLPTVAFAAGSGLTEDDPKVVDNFAELKAALTDTNTKYIELTGTFSHTMQESDLDSNRGFGAILVSKEKVLTLSGDATFYSPMSSGGTENHGAFGNLIYVSAPGKLTINGTGKLKMKASGTSTENAVIYNYSGTVIVEGTPTITGSYNTAVDGHAILTNLGTTTIYGGTFIGENANNGVAVSSYAVGGTGNSTSGSTNIYDGNFSATATSGAMNKICYGFELSHTDDAKCNHRVKIYGGTFEGIGYSVGDGKYISSFLADGCNFYKGDSVFNGSSIVRTSETLTVKDPSKHTVNVENGSASHAQAANGDTVTITANPPESGKQFKDWTILEGDVTLDDDSNPTTTFTMGSENVSVKANYITIISSVNVTATEPVDGAAPATPTEATNNTTISDYGWFHGAWGSGSLMAAGEKFIAGETYYLHVVVDTTTDYSFSATPSVHINGKTATMVAKSTSEVNYYYEFTVSESTTISTVNVTVPEPVDGAVPAIPTEATNNTTISDYGWFHGAWGSGSLMTAGEKFIAGETYYLHVVVDTTTDYSFSATPSVHINGKTATMVANSTSEVNYYYEFTVPESSTPTSYGITITNGKAYYPLGTIVTAAAANTDVSITADPAPAGKVFDKWIVKAGGITVADANSATTTFTMPATAVEIEATYKDDTGSGETIYNLTGGGTFTKGSTEGLTFTSDAPYSKFARVEIDDTIIFDGYYDVAEGSTIVTLKPEYLNDKPARNYSITIVSDDGYATGTFTIQEAGTTPGGDEPIEVSYTVEHYKQTADGYELADTETLTGNEGDTATATPKNYSGFTYDAGNANEVKSGTLTAAAGLTLKLYYNLNGGGIIPGTDPAGTITHVIMLDWKKVVESNGTQDPGVQTFTLELYKKNNDNIPDPTGLSITTTGNGIGTFEGKLSFSGDNSLEGNLSEGFYLREVKETKDGWTYSDEAYFVCYDLYSHRWMIQEAEAAPGMNPKTYDEVSFTNIYDKDKSTGGGGDDDDDTPTTPGDDTPSTPGDDTPSTPGNNNSETGGDGPVDPKEPQTGDNSHTALWIALAGMSLLGMIAALFGKKRLFSRSR